MDFLHFLISWKYWKLELIDSVLKLIKLYQASELILDFWIFWIKSYQASELILDFWIFHEILDMYFLFGPRFWIIQSYPGNIGSYDPYLLLCWCRGGSRGVAGGRGGRGRGGTAAAAATTSQQLSHLARALDHHAQGPNIPFGVNPSLRQISK